MVWKIYPFHLPGADIQPCCKEVAGSLFCILLKRQKITERGATGSSANTYDIN